MKRRVASVATVLGLAICGAEAASATPTSLGLDTNGQQSRLAEGLNAMDGLQIPVRHGLLGDRHGHNRTHEKFSRTLDKQLVDVAPTFRQPFSFYIAEVFKVVDGTTVPYQMESGW